MNPYYDDGRGIVIYRGDCRLLLPTLPKVDLLLTDPPYGVLEPGDFNARVRDDRGGVHGLARETYATYLDTYDNFVSVIVPALNDALTHADRGAVFTGPHITEQRKPVAIGGVYCPAGSGRHQWGFKTFLPVLFYGKAPDLNLGAKPNTIASSATVEKNGHPCPKPIEWMQWLVQIGSREGELILDPFLGSGTTLVACKRLGRRGIGIEIEEKYCEIAARRCEAERLELFEAAGIDQQMALL